VTELSSLSAVDVLCIRTHNGQQLSRWLY